MVKKKREEGEELDKTKKDESKLIAELIFHYQESDKYLEPIRNGSFSWDEREQLLIGELMDAGSKNVKSKVNTQDLVNIVLDGACRVMAQFPTGTIQALNTISDKGKNLLMKIIHEKYIIPNADSQYDFLTKLRIWNIYSRVFGSMPALIDYRIDEDYIGPDMWLIHPRSFFPQAGCTNISQMAFAQVSTWVDLDFLKRQNKGVWKNLPELIKKVKEGAKTKQQQDSKYLPVNERNNSDIQTEVGQFAQCELLTEYRKDRWITYSKEYNLIVRDIPNPQGNNELPIVMKHCFPLLDRLYGLAEFERGKTLQYAANSLLNLYLEGVQMSIFPPLLIDQNGVISSSIEYKAKAKWLMMRQGSIDQLKISPQGMNTFNSTYNFLSAQMQKLAATTNTSISAEQDSSMGKTPAALKLQGNRESARDGWDRFMMERALEQVNQKFIDLLTTKQEKPINVNLFKDDIRKIKEAYPQENFDELFNGKMKLFESQQAGSVQVPTSEWQGEDKTTIKFKYLIDSGSTMLSDEKNEHESLTEIMALILKFPEAMQQIQATGKLKLGQMSFDFGQAIKRYIITSGVQDGSKIITDDRDNPEAQAAEANMQTQVQQLGQALQQMTQQMQELAMKVEKKDEKKPENTLQYKDAPPSVKRQIEAKAGFSPGHEFTPGTDEDIVRAGISNIQGMNAIEEPVPEVNQKPPQPGIDNGADAIRQIMESQ